MIHDAGIDVLLETSSIRIVDGSEAVRRELKAAREPGALATALMGMVLAFGRIGLEAGLMSPWLHAGLRSAGCRSCRWSPGSCKRRPGPCR
jgi:transposase